MRPANSRKTRNGRRWPGGSTRPVGGLPKRVLDVVLALVALAILAPLAGMVALILLLSGGLPILARDRLVGFRGHAFDAYRFRTTQGTLIGAVLERSGIAELPRLLNVLAGSMSLVGPRPVAAEPGSCKVNLSASSAARPGLTEVLERQPAATETSEAAPDVDLSHGPNWSLHRDLAALVNAARENLRRRPRADRGTSRASGSTEQQPRTISS